MSRCEKKWRECASRSPNKLGGHLVSILMFHSHKQCCAMRAGNARLPHPRPHLLLQLRRRPAPGARPPPPPAAPAPLPIRFKRNLRSSSSGMSAEASSALSDPSPIPASPAGFLEPSTGRGSREPVEIAKRLPGVDPHTRSQCQPPPRDKLSAEVLPTGRFRKCLCRPDRFDR